MPRYSKWFLLALAGCSAPAPEASVPPAGPPPAQPRYTAAGELLRPEGWEDWILLGSSLGLGYSEEASRKDPGDFHDVLMERAAFAEYARSGRFPEKTLLALVLHEARKRESIATQGYFSGDLVALELAVKDREQFPEGWAYFDFGKNRVSAAAKPTQRCYDCHLAHGTDNVFVQFYPRLRGLAADEVSRKLLAIAAGYLEYGRVDDGNRWAPEMCVLSPSVGRVSGSADGATHGGKLYYLFARDREAYVTKADPQPVGQVLVKEAWSAAEVKGDPDELPRQLRSDAGGTYELLASRDGKHYRPGEKVGLFILYKDDPGKPDTDAGWVYGTVSPDGQRVLTRGRVSACMSCHETAPQDRLFGLPAEDLRPSSPPDSHPTNAQEN
jgi:cytochrome c553